MNNTKKLLLSGAVLLLITACGIKGPLFLPPTQPPEQSQAANQANSPTTTHTDTTVKK